MRAASRVLELQRAYGNRRVARWVLSRKALADTATGDNRALAQQIDEIRKLEWVALNKRHQEVETALAAGPTGAELERLSRVRDAIDFVRAERMKGNWTPPYPGHDTDSAAQLRGAALREIQRHGSVDLGLDAFDKRFPHSEEADKQSRQLMAEKEIFAKRFESQAKQNADKAFGAGTSARFRQLLGRAEGKVHFWEQGAKANTVKLTRFGEHSRSNANITFLEGEAEMRTGDYVWRWTYDLLYDAKAMRRLPQPEAAGPQLNTLLALE